MNMKEPFVQINNLTFSYGKGMKPVFQDFNLSFDRGCVYGLLGKNGTGKTTLLYLMGGLLRPCQGEVRYDGRRTFLREVETLQNLFLVPEEFALPDVPLKTYVRLTSVFYPRFSQEALRRSLETFELDADVHLKELSMGQKKKAFMSFALAANTPLLLMDEPSNGLDIPSKSQFRKVIASNMDDDKLILISTHQVRDIDTLLDHVTIMDGSNLLLNESVNEITSKLAFREVAVGESLPHTVYSQPSPYGQSVVRLNKDGEDTPLNLETLFNAAITEREKIRQVFN